MIRLELHGLGDCLLLLLLAWAIYVLFRTVYELGRDNGAHDAREECWRAHIEPHLNPEARDV